VQYAGQFSLSILAVSSAYFLDLQEPLTYMVLVMIPLLFGYTAYISREGFKTSTLLASVALIFAPLNIKMAVIGVVIFVGNILTSLFSRNNGFRNYYRTVSIPVFVTGIVLGGMFYVGVSASPELGDETRSILASTTSDKAAYMIEETQIIEMQRRQEAQTIEQTSTLTVKSTQNHVLNNLEGELQESDMESVVRSFQDAEREVPSQLETGEIDEDSMDLENNLKQGVKNLFAGNNIAFLAPVIVLSVYGLRPLIGVLTGLSAVLFERADRMSG